MFIFKAVKRHSDLVGPTPDEYFVTQADSYEVKWTRANDLPDSPRYGSSESVDDRVVQIDLLDFGQSFPEGRTLFVGYMQSFDRVYVMNEHGKTVDTIRL